MTSYLKIRLISTTCSIVYTASMFVLITVFLKSNGFELEYSSEQLKVKFGSADNSPTENQAATSSALGTSRHNSTMTRIKSTSTVEPRKFKITQEMVQAGRQNLKQVQLPRTDSGLGFESL